MHGRPVERAVAGQRTAVNLQGLERAALDRGDVLGLQDTLVAAELVDGTLELLESAPRPLKPRDRVRFHAGTSEVMARVLLLDRAQLAPGDTAFARFRLEAPVVALPGDRFVVRSYSPIVTIGGGTLLDIDPPRFKRKTPALVAHLTLLADGSPEAVVEEHVRQAGAAGTRTALLSGRVGIGPARLRMALDELLGQGRLLAVDRDWYLHPESHARFRALMIEALEQFHRANPLRSGMSREELRGRVGAPDDKVFAYLVSVLQGEGLITLDRDKVRLAAHEVRLSGEQQRARRASRTGLPEERGRPARVRRRPCPARESRAGRSTSSFKF